MFTAISPASRTVSGPEVALKYVNVCVMNESRTLGHNKCWPLWWLCAKHFTCINSYEYLHHFTDEATEAQKGEGRVASKLVNQNGSPDLCASNTCALSHMQLNSFWSSVSAHWSTGQGVDFLTEEKGWSTFSEQGSLIFKGWSCWKFDSSLDSLENRCLTLENLSTLLSFQRAGSRNIDFW